MKANDQVPAPEGKITHGFHSPGQPSRANLVVTEAQRWQKSRHDSGNPGNVGLMEDRADLLRRRIELYRRYLREGVDLLVAAAPLRICRQVSPPVFRRNSMSADGHLSPSQIHSRLDHPIIDGDEHWVGYDPVFGERMPEATAGGPVQRESHHGRD